MLVKKAASTYVEAAFLKCFLLKMSKNTEGVFLN